MASSEEGPANKRRREDGDSEDDEQYKADLQARKADLQARIAELESEKRDLERQNSVYDLLDAMPSMAVNKMCPPSIVCNMKARETVTKYRSEMLRWSKIPKEERDKTYKPTRFEFHEPAKIVQSNFHLEDYLKFDMNLRDGNGHSSRALYRSNPRVLVGWSCDISTKHHIKIIYRWQLETSFSAPESLLLWSKKPPYSRFDRTLLWWSTRVTCSSRSKSKTQIRTILLPYLPQRQPLARSWTI